MMTPIVIFASDHIRGNIILKGLQYGGFNALLHEKTIDAGKIINRHSPAIIILDTKDYSANELNFFKAASPLIAETALILLGDSSGVFEQEMKIIKNLHSLQDPLDTNLITSTIKMLLSPEKSSISTDSEPVPTKKEEVEEDISPENDPSSLEGDLKSFLDLE
ncbi:hypothetical protein H8E50_03825 [bacterium]|nr:hypothetical protein [bacterium]